MQSFRPTIILTGANRGVGFEIAKRIFIEKYPSRLILACRDLISGNKALQNLYSLSNQSKCEASLEELDLASNKSIDTFKDIIKQKYEKIDALINNAAYAKPDDIFLSHQKFVPFEERDMTVKVSYYNTILLTETLLPYLNDNGKILMVSSMLGKLQYQNSETSKILSNPNITKEQIDNVAQFYLQTIKGNIKPNDSFNKSAYCISKAMLNAYSRFILRKKMKNTQQLYIATPGWCKTTIGTDNAPNTPESGAEIMIYLLNLPYKYNANYDCKFFEGDKEIGFD